VAAVAAQFSQAGGSFVLQVVAARSLAPESFGVFALLIGAIVVATGVMTGFVGDSLTVLDRGAPRVRAALLVWFAVITGLTLVAGVLTALATGLVDPAVVVLFGLTMAVWVVEDTVRRLLMATLRFGAVVVIDVCHAVWALALLAVLHSAHGALTLTDFMLALLAGQTVAVLVGLVAAPPAELVRPPLRGAAMAEVARFGVWRGLQQGIRPATLTVARVLVALAAGSAAVGQLEAARVFTAPALLFVQGVGSFLLATYAADRAAPVRVAVRRADRAVAALLGVSVVMGVVATALAGPLGGVVTGGRYALEPVAVAGWAGVAAAVACVMPYASLAAVRGRQMAVVLLRLVDAALSVAAAAAVLWWSGLGWEAVPFAVAAGALVGAVLQRMVVLGSAEPVASPPVPRNATV
jgi:O-antigen/teichoic acid export membrane protein